MPEPRQPPNAEAPAAVSFVVTTTGIALCACCARLVCIPCTAEASHPVTHDPITFHVNDHATCHVPLEPPTSPGEDPTPT